MDNKSKYIDIVFSVTNDELIALTHFLDKDECFPVCFEYSLPCDSEPTMHVCKAHIFIPSEVMKNG